MIIPQFDNHHIERHFKSILHFKAFKTNAKILIMSSKQQWMVNKVTGNSHGKCYAWKADILGIYPIPD